MIILPGIVMSTKHRSTIETIEQLTCSWSTGHSNYCHQGSLLDELAYKQERHQKAIHRKRLKHGLSRWDFTSCIASLEHRWSSWCLQLLFSLAAARLVTGSSDLESWTNSSISYMCHTRMWTRQRKVKWAYEVSAGANYGVLRNAANEWIYKYIERDVSTERTITYLFVP